MTDILAIADRCERATAGDRELDLEILRAITGKNWFWLSGERSVTWEKYGPKATGNPVCSLEQFSASIDDALILVPEGALWAAGHRGDEYPGSYFANVMPKAGLTQTGVAESAALALCAAALRARDAVSEGKGRGNG